MTERTAPGAPAAALTAPLPAALAAGRGIDAVTALSCYLFLLMAIPASQVVGAFGAAGPPATLFGAGLACWYLIARAHPGLAMARGRQPVRAGAALFCCAILASYVAANRTAMSSLEANGADRGLIMLACWLGVLLVAADGITDRGRLDVLISRMVFWATALSVIGVIEFATATDLAKYIAIPGLTEHHQYTDLMLRNGLARAMATAQQPLEFSAVLAMILPLAIHQARHAPAPLRPRRWAQVTLIASCVPLAVSRSAVLSLLVAGLVLAPGWSRSRRLLAALGVLAAPLALWLAAPGIFANFAAVFGQLGTDTSSKSRASALSAALPMIAAHPWFGHGFQTFFPQTYFFVDDEFVTTLIETGVVGLAAVLALFAAGLLAMRQVRRAAVSAQAAELARSLTAALAVAAVSFASFDVLSFPIAAGTFFLVLGCAGAAWRLAASGVGLR